MKSPNNSIIQIKEITLTISIPLTEAVSLPVTQDFSKAEKFFIQKRDEAKSPYSKVEFDRASALMKYATCYHVKLYGMNQVHSQLQIKLVFNYYKDFVRFQKYLEDDVAGAKMA